MCLHLWTSSLLLILNLSLVWVQATTFFLTFHQPPMMNSQVLFGLSAKYIMGLQMQLNFQWCWRKQHLLVCWLKIWADIYCICGKGRKVIQVKLTAVCAENVMLLHYLPRLHCSRTFHNNLLWHQLLHYSHGDWLMWEVMQKSVVSIIALYFEKCTVLMNHRNAIWAKIKNYLNFWWTLQMRCC